MNQRINFSKRGQWVLDSHQNQYQTQLAPQFKIDYSSKNPTQNEIQKANQSLQLLKQKMYKTQKLRNKTPVKPNGYPTKKIQSQVDLPSNYRKVYQPQTSFNGNTVNKNDQQILDSLNQLNNRIDNNKFQSNRINNKQIDSRQDNKQNKKSFNNNKFSNYDPYKNIREYNKPADPKKQIIEMYKKSLLENEAKNFQSKNMYEKQNTYDASLKYNQGPSQNDYSNKRQQMQQKTQNNYNQQSKAPKNNYNQYSKAPKNNYGNVKKQQQNQYNDFGRNQKYEEEDQYDNYQYTQQNQIQQRDKNMRKANTFGSSQHYTQKQGNSKNQKYNVKRPVPQRDISPEDDFQNDQLQNDGMKDENQRILEEAERLKNAQLYPCTKGCGRKFIKDALVKHQKICEKMQKKKRKVFDSHQQRKNIEGAQMNEVKKVTNKKLKEIKKQKKAKKVSKWKLESAQLRQQIIAARGGTNKQTSKEMEEQNKLLQEYQQSSMLKCQFCGRTFNEQAGKRHIVHCERKAKENQFKMKNQKAKEKVKRPVKKRYQFIFL